MSTHSCRRSRRGRSLVVLGVGLVVGVVAVPAATADTFTVDRLDDDASASACLDATPGDCSLRGAILRANALPGADTVLVPAGTYTLAIPGVGENAAAAGDLDITGDLALAGAGADTTIIQACTVDQKTAPCPPGQGIPDDRVFHVDPDAAGITVEISGVTIRHGGPDQVSFVGPNGGGLLLGGHLFFSPGTGRLTLSSCNVGENLSPTSGGGIFNNGGTLIVASTTVSGNLAASDGGGIASNGTLTVRESSLRDNTIFNPFGGGGGGGIVSYGGVVSIAASTVSGNGKPADATGFPAAGCGGGLRIDGGELSMTNVTVSGNRGGDTGGGLCVGAVTNASIRNSTITGNTTLLPAAGQGGGGIYGGIDVTLSNTIVAGNTAANGIGHDCRGSLSSGGYNLIGDAIPAPGTPPWCALAATTGDQVGTSVRIDAKLGPLADNGGPTRTHALLADSPALDAGNPAAPGSGGFACAATDQRDVLRPQDGNADGTDRCDIGAFELAASPAVFSLSGAQPSHAGNTSSVLVLVYGSGFLSGLTVELRRAGETAIVGAPMSVRPGGMVAATTFDLAGRATGPWDLAVTNPDGASASKAMAFTVEETRPAELWADLVVPSHIRAGRPVRVFLVYGNRGNVDALGVPLVIGVPRTVPFKPRFPITPPPPLPGQAAIDWTRVPATMGDATLPGIQAMSFFVPAVPAGFVGMLDFTLTAPFSSVGSTIEMPFGIGTPYFGPPIDPQTAARLTKGVRRYAHRILEAGLSHALDPLIEASISAQLLTAAQEGALDLLNGGSPPRVYAIPHFIIGGAIAGSAGAENCKDGIDNDNDGLVDANDPDCADEDDGGDDDDDNDDDDEPECDPEEAENPWYGDDNCDGTPDCLEGGFNTCAPPPCEKWPPTACGGPPPGGPAPVGPYDPNEKVGSLGAGAEHYVTGADPLRYLVLFENLETASAAAQDVVITDPLDVATLDPATVSLGPITFGDTTVVPTPGLTEFRKDVDLRPGRNLLVRITAGLDAETGLLTWRFASLDPVTHEPPEDPLAGFLPPNVSPPEGEGSVGFTIRQRAGLATGTVTCNEAGIVFDVNPPILTPRWCNTLDNTPPSSQVSQPAGAVQTSASFEVQWSGGDVGSGIRDYSVFVRQDDGPFTPFVSLTTDTSATFTGEPGHSYAFYSVARDLTLNTEEAPAAPDVVTTIDLCPSDTAKASPGTCGCGIPDADRDGDGTVECTTRGHAFGSLRLVAGGHVTFRAAGGSGQPRGALTYRRGSSRFVADHYTAFVVDGRTARMAGIGRDGRPFLAYAEDGAPDRFRLWIDGAELAGDGSLARGSVVVRP